MYIFLSQFMCGIINLNFYETISSPQKNYCFFSSNKYSAKFLALFALLLQEEKNLGNNFQDMQKYKPSSKLKYILCKAIKLFLKSIKKKPNNEIATIFL